MKRITDLGSQECICCTTQEERGIIMDMMDDAGLTWITGMSYKDLRLYDVFSDVCFYPKKGTRSNKISAKGDVIYPASLFIGTEQVSESKRQPKQGEWVFVRNSEDDMWIEKIFLCEIPRSKKPYVCVAVGYDSEYSKGEKVGFNSRKYIKQLPQEVIFTYTIECTEKQYEKVKDMILNSK